MAIGVSYFGNRILRHVAADMDGLAAAGFTGVLHTMSENDLAYYRGQMGKIVARSQAAGLEVQIGPWGLGRTFGGEAETLFVAAHPETGQVLDSGRRVAAGCPNAPEFRAFVRTWATAAVETGAERIFWDEPHWAHPVHFDEPEARWGCRCPTCQSRFASEFGAPMPATLTPEVVAFRDACLVEFIGELVAHVATQGARSTVCLLPAGTGTVGLDATSWRSVAALPGLDTLATDPYWQAFKRPVTPFVTEQAGHLLALGTEFGIGAQLWIQGFRLGPADESDIRAAVAAARMSGITDLWTWGYEACAHMTYLSAPDPDDAPADAEKVWSILTDALTHPSGPVAAEMGGPDALARPASGSGAAEMSGPGDRTDPALTSGVLAETARLGALVTEGFRPELADLDLRPAVDLVRLMAEGEREVAAAVDAAAPAIAATIEAVAERLGKGGRLVYVGAGTAGRIGVLDAAECGPTFGTGDLVVALLAGGPNAVVRPKEGAEDDAATGAAELTALGIGANDAVIGISASGRTPYVLGAIGAARRAGAFTAALACHPGSQLSAAAELAIEIVVGPEVISGSTRLKAGSAQKLVLNAISTGVMVKLGRTFGNLMVDVSSGSEKLRARARRIVAQATGLDLPAATSALEAAGGEIKTAIVATLAAIDVAEARTRLTAAGGSVRQALQG